MTCSLPPSARPITPEGDRYPDLIGAYPTTIFWWRGNDQFESACRAQPFAQVFHLHVSVFLSSIHRALKSSSVPVNVSLLLALFFYVPFVLPPHLISSRRSFGAAAHEVDYCQHYLERPDQSFRVGHENGPFPGRTAEFSELTAS